MWVQRKTAGLSVLSIVVLLAVWVVLLPHSVPNLDLDRPGLLTKWTAGGDKCGGRCDRVFSDVFSSLVSAYRECLQQKIANAYASRVLSTAVSDCLGNAMWRLLDVKTLKNRDDQKQILLPPSDVQASGEWANCTEITLGIGRDIEAELLLRKAQPHCKFYGADPVTMSGSVFNELGEYFQVAVAAEPGFIQTWVQQNAWSGKYVSANVSAVTLVDFIRNYVKTSKVDYLFIDNEGAEYDLFDKVISKGVLEENGITVCQIATEMHLPFKQQRMTDYRYNNITNRLIGNSSFLPILFTKSAHIRTFLINVQDPYCVGKYFRSKWCGDFQYYEAKK